MRRVTTVLVLTLQQAAGHPQCGPLTHAVGHSSLTVDAQGARKLASTWGADFFPTSAPNDSWLTNDVYCEAPAYKFSSQLLAVPINGPPGHCLHRIPGFDNLWYRVAPAKRAAESTASAGTSGVEFEQREAAAAEGLAKVPGWEVLDGEGDSSLSRSSTTDKASPEDAARPKRSASLKKNKNKAAKEVKSRRKSRHEGGALFGGSKTGKSHSRLASRSKDATAGEVGKAKRKKKATSKPTLRYRRLRRIQKAKGR